MRPNTLRVGLGVPCHFLHCHPYRSSGAFSAALWRDHGKHPTPSTPTCSLPLYSNFNLLSLPQPPSPHLCPLSVPSYSCPTASPLPNLSLHASSTPPTPLSVPAPGRLRNQRRRLLHHKISHARSPRPHHCRRLRPSNHRQHSRRR